MTIYSFASSLIHTVIHVWLYSWAHLSLFYSSIYLELILNYLISSSIYSFIHSCIFSIHLFTYSFHYPLVHCLVHIPAVKHKSSIQITHLFHNISVAALFLAVHLKQLMIKETGQPVMIAFCVGIAVIIVFDIILYLRSKDNEQYSMPSGKGQGEK